VLNYTVSTCGAVYPSIAAAWIDYNGDNALDDWERIVPFSSNYGLNSVSFRAAMNESNHTVIAGKTWLRVQMQETNALAISPCVEFAFGGTKDFTINLARPYCDSGPTATSGSVLGSVSLQGVSTKISSSSSCPSGIGPQDLTAQSADLLPLAAYVLNYNVMNCGNPNSGGSAAWIDFNQNGIFEQWEQITPFSTVATNNFAFKVPPTTPDEQVLPGTTRLRVQVQTDATTAPLNPCGTFKNGNTKDFTIKILSN